MKRIAFFVILTCILCLIVVVAAPDLFKLTKESSIPVLLGESKGSGPLEDALVQKIRDEVVFKGLSEMALSEEHQAPLPRGGNMVLTDKLEEQEKMRILENSSFYHELGKIVLEEERQREFFNVPRPKTSDAKGADVPLPEDAVAHQFIASLREQTKEHEGMQQDNPGDTALDIRGPAANRKINYIPPPLQSKPSVDGDVLLKFWVLPDGTVGKVIPLVTEGTSVYLAAINHIKQYRFEPLPKDSPQIETWGVIPLRSVLR